MKPALNILLVDDEPDAETLFRQRFRTELKEGSLRIESAQSGPDALTMLKDFHKEIPLLILSDINMPGMNGIELLKMVRSKYPGMRVWMVSAYFQNQNYIEQARSFGAEAFIPKPIDFLELKERIFAV